MIADLLEKMRQQLEEQLPTDSATLDQIEAAAGKIGRQLGQDVREHLTKQSGKQPRPPETE
jgi:hypothetical protein